MHGPVLFGRATIPDIKYWMCSMQADWGVERPCALRYLKSGSYRSGMTNQVIRICDLCVAKDKKFVAELEHNIQ